MNSNTAGTLGRILFAVPFLVFGFFHFMNGPGMATMVPSYIPGGVFWVYLTGLANILAAISIVSGKQTRLACYLLALMLLVFILTIHLPGMSNPETQQMAMMSLLKDTGLMGGALILASKYEK